MKRTQIKAMVLGLALIGMQTTAAEHKELKAFPAAKAGMERHVIVLPHKERGEEESFKVELIPGKTQMTDGVNLVRMGATVEPRPLKGWGYTFYEVTGSDRVMSTRIAAAGGKQVKKFVQGKPLQIRYNSRLPIVIYAPKGYEIRYRIWSAPEKLEAAERDQT
jgi:ecotin